MNFNPIFVQLSGQAETIDMPKQLKLNNPTYLFSDIIKLVGENSNNKTPVKANTNSTLLASVQNELQNMLSELTKSTPNGTSEIKSINAPVDNTAKDQLDTIENAITALFNSSSKQPIGKEKSAKTGIEKTKNSTALAANILSLLQSNNPIILKLNLEGSDFTLKISKPSANEVRFNDIRSSDFNYANSTVAAESVSPDGAPTINSQNNKPSAFQQITGVNSQKQSTEKLLQTQSINSDEVNDTSNSSLNAQLGINENLNAKKIEKGIKNINLATSQTPQNKFGNEDSSKTQLPEISNPDTEIKLSAAVLNNISTKKLSIGASGLIEQPGQKIYIAVSKDNKLIAGQDSKPIKSLSSKIGNGDWIEISLNNTEQPNSPTQSILTDKYQNGEFLNTLKSKPGIEISSILKINDIKNSDPISKITQNYSTKPDLMLSKGNTAPKESVPASADLINDASSSIGSKIQPVVVIPNNSAQNSNETTHSPLISATQNSNGSKINLNENLKFSNQNEEQNQKQTLDKKQINYDQNISGQSFTHDLTVALKNDAPVQLPSLSAEVMKTVKANELMNEINRFVQQGNSKSALLKLDPENLGKVKIVLDVVDKSVHASVEVENENVRQIVQNNINELKQSLNLSGLQLSSVNVSLNNNDENTNKSLTQKKKSGYNQYERKIEEPAGAVSSKSMGYNTYDYLI